MRKNNKQLLISIILILFLAIGIGYALITSNLSITGTTEIGGNTWDVHFSNLQVTSGSVTPVTAAAIDPQDNTKVTYSIKLDKPGDFYEFTVNVINNGTMDGMINSIDSKVNNQAISNLPSYLEYSLTYDDGTPLANNHLLVANGAEVYRLRISFKEDINNNDLPSNAATYSFAFSVEYIQKNTNAIPVPHP